MTPTPAVVREFNLAITSAEGPVPRLLAALAFRAERRPGVESIRARQDRILARVCRIMPTGEWYLRREWHGVRVPWDAPHPVQPSRMTPHGWQLTQEQRKARGKSRMACTLADKAGQLFDEHGSSRGDYRSTTGLDWVNPVESCKAPYLDSGGAGLGLIAVSRRRVYAKSCTWYPKTTEDRFLVGRNESGTYFAHPVPRSVASVRDAIRWIWSGKQDRIIARQGDIAVIKGQGKYQLPYGHVVGAGALDTMILHATHPPIALPGRGETVIVARRAATRVNGGTRD